MNPLILTIGAAIFLSCSALATESDRIEDLISKGEFTEAQKLIGNSRRTLSEFKSDSLLQIMTRIKSDFRIKYEDGVAEIQDKYPNASIDNINDWEKANYIETRIIDGQKYMFRKSLSNLERLVPELSADKQALIIDTDKKRETYVSKIIAENGEVCGLGTGRRITLKYAIDVDADVIPDGKMIRVWMPFPIESVRQKNVKIISSTDSVVFSTSPTHNTIYMERESEKGKAAHFQVVFAYDVYPMYYTQEYLFQNVKPYNKKSEEYIFYTSTDWPQILLSQEMKALAEKIVGNAKHPVVQASLVFNWIDAHFPWAGAREYSTIPNLAEYALERGYGDCGQVSLLYITLLRNLGIPARWESGWALEPGDAGIHDWAEIYFEGVGWVPCDMSYGILKTNMNPDVMNFYKAGIDFYRFAANRGVNGRFYPDKKYIRSETVDSQLGEVEWDGGNIFYYQGWFPSLEVVSVEKIAD